MIVPALQGQGVPISRRGASGSICSTCSGSGREIGTIWAFRRPGGVFYLGPRPFAKYDCVCSHLRIVIRIHTSQIGCLGVAVVRSHLQRRLNQIKRPAWRRTLTMSLQRRVVRQVFGEPRREIRCLGCGMVDEWTCATASCGRSLSRTSTIANS